jgi:DNA-binding PadR family transcriptional regulator
MPKPFPVLVHIEEIALGTVLRKLHEMPGVSGVDLQLGQGGQGAGKQQLQHAAQAKRGSQEEALIKLLLQGPKHLNDMVAAIGGKKGSFYTLTSKLRQKGIIESAGKGMWQLTHKTRRQLGDVKALPAPQIKHGPAGRATPGSGPILLRSALAAGPMAPAELRMHLGSNGMSPKSISGVIWRAREAGLIKKLTNGSGYELTAKGQKIETGASANG